MQMITVHPQLRLNHDYLFAKYSTQQIDHWMDIVEPL